MRWLIVTMLVCLLSSGASAQSARAVSAAPAVPIGRGAFIALSVPDLQASIAWYTRVFDLRQTAAIPAMGHIAGGALLEGSGLVVELLQHREAKPGTRPPELTHGFAKVGVLVDDLDAFAGVLRASGAVFFSEPQAARPGQRPNFMLQDNAGNFLQFLGPKTPP